MAYPFFLTKWLIRTGLARFLPGLRRQYGDGTAFLRYCSDRVLATPHAELGEAAAWFAPQGPDVIDLALGAPQFDPPAPPRTPGQRLGASGLPELCEAVAQRLSAEHRLPLDPAHDVLITHGAAGALAATLDAFVNPGDRVVLFDPTSPLFALTLCQRRARVRWVPAAVETGRLRFRLDRLAGALHRARLLVLANPANPTGGVLAPEDWEQVAWWADHHDVLIYCDEAFGRFRYEGEGLTLGALPKGRARTLLAGGVSKGHGLAAARVGWLAGHRPLIRACAMAAGLHGPGVPTLCQQLALAALGQPESAFAAVLKAFDARRRYAHERLTAAGLRAAWPAGGFFFWVDVRPLGLTGRTFAAELLRAKRVVVVPGELFGPGGAGHVRVSYAAEDGRLREGLTRLADFVRPLRPAAPVNACPVAATPTRSVSEGAAASLANASGL